MWVILETKMTMRVEIQWIIKHGGNLNPHERIQTVGGFHGGKEWRRSEEDAIAGIKDGKYEFFVNHGGRQVNVKVAYHGLRAHLKTVTDYYLWDNPLALPNLAA